MRSVLAILLVPGLGVVSAFSQTTTEPPAADAAPAAEHSNAAAPGVEAPAPVVPTLDANAVKAEVEAVKAKRKKEQAQLEADLAEAEENLKGLLAREAQLNLEPGKIKQDIADRKARMDETYQAMTDIEGPFRTAEQAAKEVFKKKIIGALQKKYDAEYNEILAKHMADTAFVEANRIKPAEFDKLTVSLDPENPSHEIRFEGGAGNSVSGWFMTMNFDRGQKVWHPIPAGATFRVNVPKRNPFVADVLIHFGSDILGCGSTNVLDWDIHMYIGKNYEKKDGEKDKMFFVGVSWPVDLGRPVCWQSGVGYVYDVTPKPVRAIADESTPDIAKQIAEWVFDDPGWLKKKKDAVLDHEAKKRDHGRSIILSESRLARNTKAINDCKDKQKEEQDKIDDIKRKLEEYKEDDPTALPPQQPAGTDGTLPAATNAAPASPEGL